MGLEAVKYLTAICPKAWKESGVIRGDAPGPKGGTGVDLGRAPDHIPLKFTFVPFVFMQAGSRCPMPTCAQRLALAGPSAAE